MLIAVEGVDAAGKATQSKLLAERLKAKLVSFPAYDTPHGRLVKAHLQRVWEVKVSTTNLQVPMLIEDDAEINATFWDVRRLDAIVFQALQLANKMELASQIEHWRAQGHVVLDRYWPSACVYGALDGAGDLESLIRLHACLPQPDAFLLLDVPMSVASERLQKRAREKDRYELQPQSVVEERIAAYRNLWLRMRKTSLRWVIVDGSGTVKETERRIDAAVFKTVEDQI